MCQTNKIVTFVISQLCQLIDNFIRWQNSFFENNFDMHIATAQSSVQLFNRTSHTICQFTRLPTIGQFFFWETFPNRLSKTLRHYKIAVKKAFSKSIPHHDERPCVVDRIWLSVCEVNARISKCYQLPFFVSASYWNTDDSKPT